MARTPEFYRFTLGIDREMSSNEAEATYCQADSTQNGGDFSEALARTPGSRLSAVPFQ
jgi:hypothetical protein